MQHAYVCHAVYAALKLHNILSHLSLLMATGVKIDFFIDDCRIVIVLTTGHLTIPL